ncbi:uncharacterized protein Z520_00455 [Fonsecaea multimorphosa CBS 102226]|uniref:ADF-H domain-containing protein n=1 Tax=Fonsecaea multimorphosa CBS 102226 TaxID=1442371 RepID=A0A0D2L3X1_9EURO|nr:uncharacterized protein Z520_00455 [Fonsecaea multimorphosa CBS 102226]KIY03764.1 hypothetical protein Z520_00455 [Fonsecaea multimorphosa CBS 102226]OAL32457.1 hypothetical protein AYO22_00479 [Fonsecaea multimorphosa]
MSLNGLDGAAVADAHQAAQADAGGWFLLKYVNRDTVDLLSKGTGGVSAVRTVIEQYAEKSPLYGLVQYRRKKVVLKYVPEGTSRLLQVRLTVQFQSVLETITPHDTVFSFTAPSELSESALGLCTMLLPSASSLTSSSSSLRRRRLNEITEDAEDAVLPADEDKEKEKGNVGLALRFLTPKLEEASTVTSPASAAYGRHELDELPASAVLAKALLAKRKEEAAAAANSKPTSPPLPDKNIHPPRKESLLPSPKPPASPLPSPLPSSIVDKELPATPDPTPPSTSEGEGPRAPDFEATSNILLETTTATATAGASDPATPRPHARHLSAAESDSISQWSSNVASYTTVKPKKKKLGPRPHVEPSHRPKTSGTTDSGTGIRPVANLPTSIRVNNKSLVSLGLRPGSQQSSRSVPGRFVPVGQSVSGAPPLPSPSYLHAPYNGGDSRSAILRPASVTGDASSTTPEKLRLMKALQLRKRNMLLAQRAASAASSTPSTTYIHNASESDASANGSSARLSSIPSQEQLSNVDEESKLTQSSYTTSPTIMTNISEEPSTKASSFSEQDDCSRTRRSLSSATSSSLTPKAFPQDDKTAVKSDGAPVDVTPPATSERVTSDNEDNHVSRSDIKAALAYLEAKPANKGDNLVLESKPELNLDAEQQPSNPPLTQDVESPKKPRRLGPPQALKLLSGGNASTSDLSEDDSLMDEIQHATVHEAMPVSVARSPVTPIMSKGSSDRLRDMVAKPPTSSHSTGRPNLVTTPDGTRPSSGSVRSISTALPQWPPLPIESAQLPLTKKATLGTGISKRIKALEVLRTKDASPPRQPQPIRETSAGTSAFSTFMKRSSFLLNQQQPPNASTENSPPKQLPPMGAPYEPLLSVAIKEPRRPPSDAHKLQKGETISVTARIVRDSSNKHPPLAPSSSYHTPLNLYRSPLIVEHEKADQPALDPALASSQPRVKSPTKSEKGRFSFSSHRSGSHTNLPRSESNLSKVSKSSHHRRHGPRSASDAASISEDKPKSSMTSRLMKRMSNLANARNRNQPATKDEVNQSQVNITQEQHDLTRENSIAESLMHVVDIGDVNVQFPESFLWKRRFIRIDDQGFLIFSQPMTDANSKSVSRKYHLSDFKRPSLPDLEREEMAWSVLLDLKDGRCVQCACESKQAQQQVLQMLVDAHSAYHQLYGAG